jgi:N,N'-diacetylchitobiose transport system permease protein
MATVDQTVGEGRAAAPTPPPSDARSERSRRRGRRPRLLPYALLAPALVMLAAVLGYPLVRLVVMSTQEFGLAQQFGTPPEFVGLDNFRAILGDPYFWTVLGRTVVFCAVNVALTMVLATLVALLLGQLGKGMRTLVSTGLLVAWAIPPLTATVVWQWLFDTQYGLVNAVLTRLGGDFEGHGWLADPLSFFAVATVIVVWMSVPFVAFTLHAGMTQIPSEIMEAAAIDGAGPWQRFWNITVPSLKPLFVILFALSTLWDLRVFTQIYVLQQAGGITRETNLLGVWTYRVSIGESRFGVGAAIALVLVTITMLLTFVHLRQVLRSEPVT